MEAELPASLKAPGHARSMLAAEFVGNGIDSSAAGPQAAVLVLSELVTNAVLHAGGPIVVTIDLDDSVAVRVAVYDESPQQPIHEEPHTGRVGGHGLGIVAEFARTWGVDNTPHGRRGKAVWAEIGL